MDTYYGTHIPLLQNQDDGYFEGRRIDNRKGIVPQNLLHEFPFGHIGRGHPLLVPGFPKPRIVEVWAKFHPAAVLHRDWGCRRAHVLCDFGLFAFL